MMMFVLKSTISLAVLYGVYYFLLRTVKMPVFTRFYLLFALVFSLAIPFISISVSTTVVPGAQILPFKAGSVNIIHTEAISNQQPNIFTFQNILIFLYAVGTMVFFVRFALNIRNIILVIRHNTIVTNAKVKIVLIDDRTLPYSFFHYVFINRADYEVNNIKNELLAHEQVHCAQYHSVDVVLVELMKVLIWFNPFVWLFGKAIQLNHEYLADQKVVSIYNLHDYQHILLNLVFRNNSTYLASNFNYSLTKKRLLMMTKNRSKSVVYRIAATSFIIAMVFYLLCCSKDSKELTNYAGKRITSNLDSKNTAWWKPILIKHNIKQISSNGYNDLVEMGSTNSIDNNIVTLTDAVVIYKGNDTTYQILKAPLVYHDLKTNIIKAESGKLETYSFNSKEVNPIQMMTFKNIKIQFGRKSLFKADEVSVQIKLPKNSGSSKEFKDSLAKEREGAAMEQTKQFQEKLALERKAAAEEQSKEFQAKLASERKAAAEGKIVVGNK